MARGSSVQCGIAMTEPGFSVFHTTTAAEHGFKYKMKEGMPLNWKMIAETMQKYWVQQACVMAVAIISW